MAAVPEPRDTAGSVPDIEWAKRNVSIVEVADLLGLERRGNCLRCWRPENHQHGDRTPSVGIWHRKNRVKCFVCCDPPLSPVDLVQLVLGLQTGDAVRWLAARFPIPNLPKGRHLKARSRSELRLPVGTSGHPLESLIRSGLWATMSDAECRLLPVLQVFTDRDTRKATLSYAAQRRYSGLASDASIQKAVSLQKNKHAVEVIPGGRNGTLPGVNSYRVTLEDARFLKLVNSMYAKTRDEVEAQRRLRSEAKNSRLAQLRKSRTPKHKSTGIRLSSLAVDRNDFPLQPVKRENGDWVEVSVGGRLLRFRAELCDNDNPALLTVFVDGCEHVVYRGGEGALFAAKEHALTCQNLSFGTAGPAE